MFGLALACLLVLRFMQILQLFFSKSCQRVVQKRVLDHATEGTMLLLYTILRIYLAYWTGSMNSALMQR